MIRRGGELDPQSGLLAQARAGHAEALDSLLRRYRRPLRVAAGRRIGRAIQARVDPSDVVQETLLRAARDFGQFQGSSPEELDAWLQRILQHCLTDHARHHLARRRDARRDQALDASDAMLDSLAPWLTGDRGGLSDVISRRETAARLNVALDQLSADHRQALLLRHADGLRFGQIGEKLGRSEGAARMLWVRGLDQLRSILESGSAL